MSPYQIILADDHASFRQWVRKTLEENTDFDVIGEAGDGLELLELLNSNKLNPHLIILDIGMPNLNGIEATRRIKTIYPDIKILILTVHKEEEYFHEAISAGAEGYLVKGDLSADLLVAVEKVRQGETYVSPLLENVQ